MSIDRNESTLGIFLDLSKAFDTINHKISSHKLWHYGIQNTALLWIKSYVENRTQFGQSESHQSHYRKISHGVPQGSNLGPLLFIIYLNNLPNVSSLTQSLLFADDTKIFCSHRNTNHLVSIANDELAKIVTWLKANKLSLNLTKTNFMICHLKQNKINVDVPLVMENTIIKQVVETKFLRVITDQHLSLPACRRLLFPLLHLEKRRLRNAIVNCVPASRWQGILFRINCEIISG